MRCLFLGDLVSLLVVQLGEGEMGSLFPGYPFLLAGNQGQLLDPWCSPFKRAPWVSLRQLDQHGEGSLFWLSCLWFLGIAPLNRRCEGACSLDGEKELSLQSQQ